jgi:3-hydroxy-9,10-secoandrosta-1,3,5(10)-triene-9,17-dione monooxygenase reductase component
VTFDEADFKAVMGRFTTGVAVVTALEKEGPVGFTCQSFISLSLDPPLAALAPAKSSTSWPRIREAGSFCVNILSETQNWICQAFAKSGGDKFVGVNWSPGVTGAPLIDSSLAWIECTLELAHDAGDHELVIGRVVDLRVGTGAPLLFYQGRFAGLRE